MDLVGYRIDGTVAIAVLNDNDNRFNPDFINAFLNVLDDIENNTEAKTIIVTSSHEKIFSNGLDVDWMIERLKNNDKKSVTDALYQLNRLFKRILTYPLMSIAAISGHAFAGGAILSCAFDFRFMRSDRGFFCFPEIDISVPLLPGMIEIVRKAVPGQKFNDLYYTGNRLTASECEANNIVRKACHIDNLMTETIAFAKSLDKNRKITAEMKYRMNRKIIQVIDDDDVPYIESYSLNGL